jgi:hypothetical protein
MHVQEKLIRWALTSIDGQCPDYRVCSGTCPIAEKQGANIMLVHFILQKVSQGSQDIIVTTNQYAVQCASTGSFAQRDNVP